MDNSNLMGLVSTLQQIAAIDASERDLAESLPDVNQAVERLRGTLRLRSGCAVELRVTFFVCCRGVLGSDAKLPLQCWA